MKNQEKNSDNIFAQIILEQAHIEFINEQLENIYDKIGEFTETEDATIFFLNNEKELTQNRIKELKRDYNQALIDEEGTCTGKIEINYENIPEEKKFQLYRFLNAMYFDTPGFNYKTIENTHYSKDYCNY